MFLKAGWQMGNSLLYDGNLTQMDLADIGFAGFGKYSFVLMAIFDFTPMDEFRLVGYGKKVSRFGTDMLIGAIIIGIPNKWGLPDFKRQ